MLLSTPLGGITSGTTVREWLGLFFSYVLEVTRVLCSSIRLSAAPKLIINCNLQRTHFFFFATRYGNGGTSVDKMMERSVFKIFSYIRSFLREQA